MSRIENALEKAARLRGADNRNGAVRGNGARGERKTPWGSAKEIAFDNPYLVAHRASSPASEEYKKLKSLLLRMTKDDPQKNVILVTSAVGGEGKSITAANLALSLSQDYDHSVLLIDADLRKPSLHTLFDLSPKSGLSDCVVDDRDIGTALLSIGNGNLSFLSSGTRRDDPVELFSSQRMRKVLMEMKYRYRDRYVIIDTPPVLLFAETKMCSAIADGVLFVIKEGRAPLQHVVDALDALKNENVLGIVYNSVTQDGSHGRSAYHHYYRAYQQ